MIVFYDPVKHAGGAESLIVNLTSQLSLSGIRVKIFAYSDSVICEQLKKRNIAYELVDLAAAAKKAEVFNIDPEDVLVCFNLFEEYRLFKKNNPRILFWIVLYSTLIETNKFNHGDVPFLTRRLIDVLIKKNGLVFMDDSCANATQEKLGIKIGEPDYLPVPVLDPVKNHYLGAEKKAKDVFSVTYVGRNEIWKYYPCLRILQDLKTAAADIRKPLVLHVVTNNIGFYKEKLDKEMADHPDPRVQVRYHDDLVGDRLRDFLVTNSDLHISMGTACLEGAALGIPSILIDASMDAIPAGYTYRWIHETQNYCLGNFVTSQTLPSNGRSLGSILKDMTHDPDLCSVLSNKCFSYVQEYHALSSITPLFLRYVERTNARMKDFLAHSLRHWKPYSFYRKIKMRMLHKTEWYES